MLAERGSKIGRAPSPLRMGATPVVAVMLGSAVPALVPFIAQSPVLPPFGLLILIGWRLLHRELWPLWIGVPLGAFDDLATGQPLGSAMFLWSVVMLTIETLDRKIMWRDYWHDWLLVLGAVILCTTGNLLLAHLAGSRAPVMLVLPQIIWSVLAYPLIVRIIARLDRWRIAA